MQSPPSKRGTLYHIWLNLLVLFSQTAWPHSAGTTSFGWWRRGGGCNCWGCFGAWRRVDKEASLAGRWVTPDWEWLDFFFCLFRGGGGGVMLRCWVKRKSHQREARDVDEEGGGGVVGRPVAERKGLLLRLDCSLSGDGEAAHSDRIWWRPVQRLHCAGIGTAWTPSCGASPALPQPCFLRGQLALTGVDVNFLFSVFGSKFQHVFFQSSSFSEIFFHRPLFFALLSLSCCLLSFSVIGSFFWHDFSSLPKLLQPCFLTHPQLFTPVSTLFHCPVFIKVNWCCC